MVSAPVPPVMVSTLATVGVGEVGQGELVGAGAEVDGAAGLGRAEGDRVGAACRRSASRRCEPSACWRVGEGQAVGAGAEVDGAGRDRRAPAVMVSAPVPPVMVSMLIDGQRVVAESPKREAVGAGAEVDAAASQTVPSVTVSAPVPPVRVSTLETVTRVGAVGEGQLVGAGAEVDGRPDERRAERDGVGLRAAGDRLDVRDRHGVGAVASVRLSVPAPRLMCRCKAVASVRCRRRCRR